jgi:diguanylate cyclase (GGDEF)-like protein/PAS domain S-box-containing protein
MRWRKHLWAVATVMAVAFACALALLALRLDGRIGEGTFAVSLIVLISATAAAAIVMAVAASRAWAGALRRAEDALGERRAAVSRLEKLLASIGDGVLVTDRGGNIERANAAANAMLGHGPDGLIDLRIQDVLIGAGAEALEPTPPGVPREASVRKADGAQLSVSYTVSPIDGHDGPPEHLAFALQSIEERKRMEQRIRSLARVDPLTKLANRMQFQHLLQQSIARAKRSQQYVALLYLDVDRFKDINDTFGHAAGDSSLEIFSRRIQAELEESAIAGRLAGDEFAVLVTSSAHMGEFVEHVSQLAARLLRAVGKPFQVHGEEIFMTTSIGIAVYPRDADNVIDLIRNSDAALYQSKKAGGNGYEFYSSEMSTAAVERLMLKSKLRRAFERDELRLHYQPKYNVRTGRIDGAEALVRWDLPERGLVYPSDFIPLAEETNLILQIGDWVLNRVCADYRVWQRTLPSPCRVSVNLSLRQLLQHRFLERVRETFRAHGVSPTSLELEITETTLMEDTERTVRILNALYGMGLHLAIDDFGTGYSSLSALQQFPISTLKIDQSFIRDVAVDRDDAAIVATIIQMAHSLKLDVVAEGVESEEQLEFLRRHGCDHVQGHLFGDPVDADAFCQMLVAEAEGSGKYRALFARG